MVHPARAQTWGLGSPFAKRSSEMRDLPKEKKCIKGQCQEWLKRHPLESSPPVQIPDGLTRTRLFSSFIWIFVANCLHSTRPSSCAALLLPSTSASATCRSLRLRAARSHHQTLNCVNTVRGSENFCLLTVQVLSPSPSPSLSFAPLSPVPNSIISTLVTHIHPARVGKLGGELSHVVTRGYLRLGWSRVFDLIRRYCRLLSHVWSDRERTAKTQITMVG